MAFSTIPDTSFVNNVDLRQDTSRAGDTPPQGTHAPRAASGEKAKARAILAAIRTLQGIEQAQRPATPEECAVLARFPGFGPVALGIFPDPVTGRYKDATWQSSGKSYDRCSHPRTTPVPGARPLPPSTPRPRSSRPCTRRSGTWGCPPMPSCWSRAVGSATSSPRPHRACASSAWNWIASPDASPACSTPP